MGFLFSYAALICNESDFFLAKDMRLLPEQVTWANWRLFAAELSTTSIYGQIDERFCYGELRLSRLNKLQYLASMQSYMPPWNRYGDFFHDQFAWLASTTVYIAVVLTAMQVGLATTYLAENTAFQSASYGFTIFSILAPLVVMLVVLAIFLYLYVSNWVATLAFRDRRFDYIEGLVKGRR